MPRPTRLRAGLLPAAGLISFSSISDLFDLQRPARLADPAQDGRRRGELDGVVTAAQAEAAQVVPVHLQLAVHALEERDADFLSVSVLHGLRTQDLFDGLAALRGDLGGH